MECQIFLFIFLISFTKLLGFVSSYLSMSTSLLSSCDCGPSPLSISTDSTAIPFLPHICPSTLHLNAQSFYISTFFVTFMALFLSLFLFLILPSTSAQPSPGYYPSSKFRTLGFYQGFTTIWGAQHQTFSQNQLTIWLDRYSGSGFKSTRPFRSGYFGVSIKLQTGYTAGVITSFYLSNNEAHPGNHDEVDIEFLGTTPGKPYTLQTNVYVRGSGDGRIIGREMKFHLWFDPTANFHKYAIYWSPNEIIFFVDDIPIRRYPRQSISTFPLRPMWVYGSIWDASSWATEDGKYKADYRYQPFVAKYANFVIHGCSAYSPARCRQMPVWPSGFRGLSNQQIAAMQWAQRNYMVYNYCKDSRRDHSLTPEC